MKLIKVGLASINTTVGAVRTNTQMLMTYAREMAEAQCTYGLFQEGTTGGYHGEDLNLWKKFRTVQMKYLRNFVEDTASYPFPTIFFVGFTMDDGGRAVNCIAVVSQGRIWAIIPKIDLAGDGVYYDPRVYQAGNPYGHKMVVPYKNHPPVPFGNVILDMDGIKGSASVCETIWHPDTAQVHSYNDSLIHFNLSASAYSNGIFQTLVEMLSTRSADTESLVLYASQVGGQDGLTFHGMRGAFQNGRPKFFDRWKEGWNSCVVDIQETETARAKSASWGKLRQEHREDHEALFVQSIPYPENFKLPEYQLPVEVNTPPFLPSQNSVIPPFNMWDDIEEALVQGLGDYFDKVGRFERILIGDSGGVDSQMAKVIAWIFANRKFAHLPVEERTKAIADFVWCISLPTKFNKNVTRNIAREFSQQLGVHFEEHSIQEEYERDLETLKQMLPGVPISKVIRGNMQSRIRGKRLMNLSNILKALLTNNGNESERAVGYTTLGGDHLGGKSVLSNMPKTYIYGLARHFMKKYNLTMIEALLKTKASSELEEGVEDEIDLMPFDVMDTIMEVFVGKREDATTVYNTLRAKFTDSYLRQLSPNYEPGMLKTWTNRWLRLFFGNVFKWVTAPEGIHIGPVDLDRERALQIPTTTSLEWLELDEFMENAA